MGLSLVLERTGMIPVCTLITTYDAHVWKVVASVEPCPIRGHWLHRWAWEVSAKKASDEFWMTGWEKPWRGTTWTFHGAAMTAANAAYEVFDHISDHGEPPGENDVE